MNEFPDHTSFINHPFYSLLKENYLNILNCILTFCMSVAVIRFNLMYSRLSISVSIRTSCLNEVNGLFVYNANKISFHKCIKNLQRKILLTHNLFHILKKKEEKKKRGRESFGN